MSTPQPCFSYIVKENGESGIGNGCCLILSFSITIPCYKLLIIVHVLHNITSIFMYFYLNLHVAIEEGVAVKLHKKSKRRASKKIFF